MSTRRHDSSDPFTALPNLSAPLRSGLFNVLWLLLMLTGCSKPPPPINDLATAQSYSWGSEIIEPGQFGKFAVYGWSELEDWGVWSDGHHAAFIFAFPQAPERDIVAKTDLLVYFEGTHNRTLIDVFANDSKIVTWSFHKKRKEGSFHFIIPPDLLESGHRLCLRFFVHTPGRPSNLNRDSEDHRHLGLALRSLKLVQSPPPHPIP